MEELQPGYEERMKGFKGTKHFKMLVPRYVH